MMASPKLRIMLVDTDHSRRMMVEKNLSHMGYHRVLPVASLTELMALLENAVAVYDLVVVNEDIALTAGFSIDQCLRDSACVKHSLIYKNPELQRGRSLVSACHFIASGVPDRPILTQVMRHVEERIEQGLANMGVGYP